MTNKLYIGFTQREDGDIDFFYSSGLSLLRLQMQIDVVNLLESHREPKKYHVLCFDSLTAKPLSEVCVSPENLEDFFLDS